MKGQPAAKASRRQMKRRETIENRVATNKLQKQINNQANKNGISGHIVVSGDPLRQKEPTRVTPGMVADFRLKSTIDRIVGMLPTSKALRTANFVQSMNAKANSAFGLGPQDCRPMSTFDTLPWLKNASLPVSLNEELHFFCDYVQVSELFQSKLTYYDIINFIVFS